MNKDNKSFVKLKEYYKIFKEYWKIPKYRTYIKLFLWTIFIVFAMMYVRSGLNSRKQYQKYLEDNNALEVFRRTDSYNYDYIITQNLDEFKLTGAHYNNLWMYKFDNSNDTIYVEDGNYYTIYNDKKMIGVNGLPVDLSKFTSDFLYKLVKKGKLDYKKENSDNSIEESYIVSINNFSKLYGSNITAEKGNITINTIVKDNKLKGIVLDLSNFVKLSNQAILIYKIDMKFKDFNKVDNFKMEGDTINYQK